MFGKRGRGENSRAARAAIFAMLLVNCGGKTRAGSTASPDAGASGAGAAGVGSPGGAPSAGATGSAGSSGGSQGGSEGRGGSSGAPNGAGSSGAPNGAGSSGVPGAGQPGAGAAGAGGEGGTPDGTSADGFLCERQTCVPGEVCVNCDFFGGAIPLICAPHPELDPDGYQARVDQAGCLAVNPVFECDGPEDCASGERCVADREQTYPLGACVAELPCEAPHACVICRTDDDCPSPSSCGEEGQSVFGARRFCTE